MSDFDLTPERRAELHRLAHEFVDEHLAGKRHRRATFDEAPTVESERERQIHRYLADRDRRAFLKARRIA